MPSHRVRPPAVAGMFYPDDPVELTASLAAMLAEAHPPALRPKAMIVPHAGYIYSGPIAAQAYALLKPLREVIRRVVLFGPAHRAYVKGLAASSADYFATPLGNVPLDREAIALATSLPDVRTDDGAHAQEHSLEVQLPFLQVVLGDFQLVPFAVGEASGDTVAQVMETLWDGADTLVVVSSDLSHYHPYAQAHQIDRETANDIADLRPLHDFNQACGALPINGLIGVAPRRGLAPHLLDLRNSGDTAGDRSRVVGYAAFAFTEAGHG